MGGEVETLSINKDVDSLYVIPFFPGNRAEMVRLGYAYYDIDWKDPVFVELLRKNIVSIKPITPLHLPEDRFHVAVHVRVGAGPDAKGMFQGGGNLCKEGLCHDQVLPFRFPPLTYYTEQLKRLSELLDDQPMYVQIFTDSSEPEGIAAQLREIVGKPNILYNYRGQGNQHDANVLEDFFALTQFEYLIRGESNFSIMAQHLGNFKVVMYPTKCVWHDRVLEITEVETEIVDAGLEKRFCLNEARK